MQIKVVDASALGAIVFNEPEAGKIAGCLDAQLVAPDLLSYEMANLCWKKLRRHPEQRNNLLASYARWHQMPVTLLQIKHGEALELAEQLGLTAYDASYLWLAKYLQAELITLDKQLHRSAKAENLA